MRRHLRTIRISFPRAGWSLPTPLILFWMITAIQSLKQKGNKQRAVDSMMASAFELDLSDCDDATQAQKRSELSLRALIDTGCQKSR